MAELIFDGLVWLIGASVVIYMLRRYWMMFKHRHQEACGTQKGSCSSCKTGCDQQNI